MKTLALIALLAACHHDGNPPPHYVKAPPPTDPVGDVKPVDPGKDPGNGVDPGPKTEGDVSEAWVHGLHVIVKRIAGSEATATQLYVRGGVRDWDARNAGIEQLAVRATVEGGTEKLPRDAFTQALADLGSSLDGYASYDWSVMYTWSLTPAWDTTFGLLVDAFRHPAMPPQLVEAARGRQLAGIKAEKDTPDSALSVLSHDTLFAGQPYFDRPSGTLKSVAGLTIEQLRAHLDKLRVTSRMLIVVVGDVEAAHVFDSVTHALGDLPRGDYHETAQPMFPHAAAKTTFAEQKLPTNYIEAIYAGPTWKQPDQLAAAMLANGILNQREFIEVRTKRNLSYAPNAWFSMGDDAPRGGLYVTAVDPVATMKVMLDEAKKLRDEVVGPAELAAGKAQLLTGLASRSESPNDQATQLAQAEMRGGDWRLVRDLPARVKALTAAQVQAFAKQYMTKLQTFVVGDPTKLDRAAMEAF